MQTPAILAFVCFSLATLVAIMVGSRRDPSWTQRKGAGRTVCAMGFASSMLMLGIQSGWLKPGISFASFAVFMLGAGVVSLFLTYAIMSTASYLTRR